jgi:hypothetical protein
LRDIVVVSWGCRLGYIFTWGVLDDVTSKLFWRYKRRLAAYDSTYDMYNVSKNRCI